MSVELLPPGALQTERLPDGRRRLIRDLNLVIDGRNLTVPKDFVTDYSSWPRALPGPKFSRVDVAGVAHDALFRWQGWTPSGEPPISYVEANRVWFKVARHGTHHDAKANLFWAWTGRIGLFAASWPVWLKYKRQATMGEGEVTG